MLKPIATAFLQHLTNQNNWSRKHLSPFAGKVVRFHIALVKTDLLILEDGSLCIASHDADIDATVHIPPSLALRLMAKDETAKMHVRIDGDTHLVSELSKVLQHMHWDIEEDLSHITGDIAANKLTTFGKHAWSEVKQQSINTVEMLREYWQEEQPVLAKKWQIEQFNNDVDTLRGNVTRLEKKLQKFKQKIQESQA